MSPTRLSCDGSHESPQRDGSPSKYTDVSGGSSGNQGHHRFILTKPRGRPPKRMQVKSTGKKGPSSSYFDEANKSEIPRRGSWEGSRETLGSKKDPGYQNTHTLGPGREEANDHNEEEKSTKRRPAWDSCVNVIGPLQPKINLRKYENELTFKPSITTKEEVYIAYTGHDRLYDSEDAAEPGDERYSSLSSDEDASDRSRSNSRSPGRNKERILSKREARAYLKMTAVYGSDAFKNQRKQWFLDKLALAQDQKAKLEEEMRKAEEKKRAEDRKKQQRQLNYVRDKFRKEQVHRFRTQYVTSRVLEHEQANRHEYGLPEDFDDGTYLNNDNSKSARSKAQATPSATNDEGKPLTPHTHLNGHSSEHKDNKPEISHNLNGSQHRKEKQSRHGLKDVTSNDEAFNANNRKQQTQKNIEEERQRQRQEKQKSWYAAYETAPRAEETRPTYETSNSLKKPLRKTLPLKTSNTAAHIKGKGTNSSEVRGAINGTNYKEENELKSSFEAENGSKAPNKLKDNSNSIEKTKNGSGKDGYIKGNNSNDINDRITNGKHGDSSNAKQARADKGDKNIHKNKKDIGPSLPHTKSHADTDNSKEKKENAPYIFTGHFRQEADGTYHKLDTIQQDKNNLDHKNSEENLPISTNEKPDNIKSSQPIPTEIVLQTDKLGDTNAKKHDMVEKNTSVSSSAQRQMVQNLVNKAKVNSQTGITTKIMSPQINSNQLNQNNHLNGRNKRKTSPTGHSDSKKSNNHLPARPSAIALLHVLEEAKPAETKQNSQPIPNDKTTDSNHEREELSRDRRSSKDVASKAVKKQLNHPKSLDTVQEVNSRRATASSGRSTAAAGTKKKPQGKSTLAHLMFDVNRGPSWDPHQKIPKMEGIDTVVIETKDGKGWWNNNGFP